MDCEKTGKLILKLRKEKGLTQKQMADALHISDKAVSKWERAAGCPDISLLPELSELFGVNIEQILLGDLNLSEKDGGNMKRIQFFMCPECGNIITATGNAEISCCGRKLSAMAAKKTDDAHRLCVEAIEDEYYITFTHEMTKQHFISFVAYVSFDRVLVVRLYPEQGGELRIPQLRGGKLYCGCSRDGLWVQEK